MKRDTIPSVTVRGGCLMRTLLQIGAWELDTAASKYEPGPPRKSDTRTYKVEH